MITVAASSQLTTIRLRSSSRDFTLVENRVKRHELISSDIYTHMYIWATNARPRRPRDALISGLGEFFPRWRSHGSWVMHLATCQARGYPSTAARFWMNNRKCLATRGAAAASLMNTLNRPGLEFTGRFTGAHAAVPRLRNDSAAFRPE